MAHFNFVISQNAKWGHAGLTETVKNEIETLRPSTAWLKFGAFYKLVNEQIECFILFCFILQVN